MTMSISSCARVRDLDKDISKQCKRREIFRLNILKAELEALLNRVMSA